MSTTSLKYTGPAVKLEPIDQYNSVPSQKSTAAFKCELCSREFNLKNLLIQHVTEYHKLPFSVVKSERNTTLTNSSLISIHSHTTQSQVSGSVPSVTCHICQKPFKYRSVLIRHLRTHSNERPFKCISCPKAFKSKYEIKIHHQRFHNIAKPFQCNLCKKSFKTRSDLGSHQRVHSDVRPYSCNLCERLFKIRGNLKKHYKCHSDVRPFQCNVCDKCFKTKYVLENHQRNHSESRQFQCNLCPKSFKTQGNLTVHQ
eukprot:909054_1